MHIYEKKSVKPLCFFKISLTSFSPSNFDLKYSVVFVKYNSFNLEVDNETSLFDSIS